MNIDANPPIAIRPRRSVLYVPGANIKALEKVRTLASDVVIIDLEDAVSPSLKKDARHNTMRALAGDFGHREVVVRINGLQTPWGHEDIECIAPLAPDAILLPKVESAANVQDLAAVMRRSGAGPAMRIWAMIETPAAFFHLMEIAAADPLIEAFVVGTTDLVTDLRGRHTANRAALLPLLALAVCAGRSSGLAVIDGVHLKINDEPGLRAACEQGRDMGFDGKSLIHPSQIDPANSVYGPSPTELAHARQIIATYDAALLTGASVAVLHGALIEALHVREAQQLLAFSGAIHALSS